MTVLGLLSGGVTQASARFRGVVDDADTGVRVAVADNPELSGPVFSASAFPFLGWTSHEVTGLDPDTQYWYALEVDGVLDTGMVGKFRTHGVVGEPYSFTFAAASCAGSHPAYPGSTGLAPDRISDHPVFDSIRLADPLWFSHMGDRWYYDAGSGVHVPDASLGTYRNAHDAVLTVPRQRALYRDVPLVYCWDDHDFGPNNADGTHSGKANAALAHRERVPSYDFAEASGPIYHSFQVGRVLVIVSDSRYNRDPADDPPPRAYLGADQVAWMDSTLAAAAAGSAEFVVWQTPQPPNSGGSTSWGGYPEERDQVRQLFGDHGYAGRCIAIAGDQHQLGMDSGSNNMGIPLYTLAPLDCPPGISGVAYDLGTQAHRGAYGTVTVFDVGQYMRVTTRGWLA